jgi:ABC-type polysaccharide transport system permease subunit
MTGNVLSVRDTVGPLVWGLVLSLVLNIAYVVVSVLRTARQAEAEGISAVGFSLPWFLLWTVVGTFCIAVGIILIRRAFH